MNEPMGELSIAAMAWLSQAHGRLAAQPGDRVLFAHAGGVDQPTLERLVALAEHASLENGDATTTRKRLVTVVLEGLENLHHHPPPALRNTAMALLVDAADGYRFAMGNAMPCVTATAIEHRIGLLNEMDGAELKEQYLKLLANDARSEHGGAGLGLFTMARRSDRPMVVNAAVLDPLLAYLCLELKVARQ